jgi:N-acetylneuraminic acid mutarotase
MSILFKPNGTLDIATDPNDLEETVSKDNLDISSTAMQRCKNMRIDQQGMATTRDGTAKINSTATSSLILNRVIPQAGDRYSFAGKKIYKNESAIPLHDEDFINASWYGLTYNAFNSETENIFATNGTDRKRIDGSLVHEWGADAPASKPDLIPTNIPTGSLTGAYNCKYSYCRKEDDAVVFETNPSEAGDTLITYASQQMKVAINHFKETTQLPDYIYGHSSVVYNGYLYVIGGGTYNLLNIDTVYYAPINSDGTIGAWNTTTVILGPGERFHTSIAYNGYLYVIGGYDTDPVNTVYYAPINSDGTVGAWSRTTVIPAVRYLHTSVVYNGYLYVIGGNFGVGVPVDTVYYALINADGTIGAWNTTTVIPAVRGDHTSVVYNGYLYVIGGSSAAATVDTVYYAPINANGTIGTWNTTTVLPEIRKNHTSVAYNGYLYVIGGYDTDIINSVCYAPINSDGTVGIWNAIVDIPNNREWHTSIAYNGYLYVIGGYSTILSTSMRNTVYYANLLSEFTHLRLYRTLTGGEIYYHETDVVFPILQLKDDYACTYTWEMAEAPLASLTGHVFCTEDAVNARSYIYNFEVDFDSSLPGKNFGMFGFENDYVYFFLTCSDGSLGSEVETDHDRPPAGASDVYGPNLNGYCFMIVDNNLYFCKPKQPEYWPADYYIEVSPAEFPGQCCVFWNQQLFYLSKPKIYAIRGSSYNNFLPVGLTCVTGAQNPNAACAVEGLGIYHVGSDGLYLWNGIDKKMSEAAFEPIFRGTTVNGVPAITSLTNCWLREFKNKLYFGYTSAGYTYPTNVLVLNLTNNKTAYYSFPMEIVTAAVDEYYSRLLIGDNAGFIRQIEKNSVTNDDGTAISWEVETKNFALQTRPHFPRWNKYDVDASDSTCDADAMLILDGNVRQTHALSGNRDVKRRLIKTGNGQRMSIRFSGTGKVYIYAVEAE